MGVKPFKRKKTKKWKIEKYCKNPLVCPLKISCSDGWRRKGGGGILQCRDERTINILIFVHRAVKRDALQPYS